MATRTTAPQSDLEPARVLLVGDRFLVLEALRLAVQDCNIAIAASTVDSGHLEEARRAFLPEIVILDATRLPIEAGTRLVRGLTDGDTAVVAVTEEALSIEAARLVSAGAICTVGLDASLGDISLAVNRLLAGRAAMPLERRYELERLMREHRAEEQRRWLPFDELTRRERDIFELVYAGLSADQIADHDCVSVNTVRTHIRSILTKLNVNSQLAAVALARTNGWFESLPAPA